MVRVLDGVSVCDRVDVLVLVRLEVIDRVWVTDGVLERVRV